MEIRNYKFVGRGCVVAKFDMHIAEWGGLTINDCTVFQKGDKKWISFPSREYMNNGEKKYFQLIRFDENTLKALQSAALKKIEEIAPTAGGSQNFMPSYLPKAPDSCTVASSVSNDNFQQAAFPF
jgi:hypothetical protein